MPSLANLLLLWVPAVKAKLRLTVLLPLFCTVINLHDPLCGSTFTFGLLSLCWGCRSSCWVQLVNGGVFGVVELGVLCWVVGWGLPLLFTGLCGRFPGIVLLGPL